MQTTQAFELTYCLKKKKKKKELVRDEHARAKSGFLNIDSQLIS